MAAADLPYRDPSLPVHTRVDDLLARMTLAEKVAQLGGVWSSALVEAGTFSAARAGKLLRHGTGHVTRIGCSTGLRPAESAAFANQIQRYLVEETRLGIPAIVHEESTAGFAARDADQLPQAIGLAATFDPDAVERAGELIRAQMLAVGARQTLAPVLDVARDPRWGRLEETYGEDPYLASRIGVAYVRGVQGDDPRHGVAATGKHFLGYAASEGGHNHKPAHIGPRELREVYARPFLAAIQEAGLLSIMNAYNEVDGLPCGGSAAILDELLRGELGFTGVVSADYFTTALLISAHRVAADKAEAARVALRAGLDVELPALDSYAHLIPQIEAGELATGLVDRSVRRALHLKIALGLLEQPYVDAKAATQVYQTSSARALARELAVKSIVLLRNEGDLLPLARDLRRIAVLGPCADDPRLLQGDYHYPAHMEIIYAPRGVQDSPPDSAPGADAAGTTIEGGDDGSANETSETMTGTPLPRSAEIAFAPGPYFPPTVTPLAGIRAAAGSATAIIHTRGCGILGTDESEIAPAVAAAREADVAIVCIGGRSGLVQGCTSGEFRDAADLGLTGVQQRLVEEVVATATPTVVVVIAGRALALPWIATNVPAVLQAWVPGEEGGSAIADVLFGLASPSGRLPITLPRSVGQVPLYSSRKWTTEGGLGFSDYSDLSATPLYPFGHGLSYTRFEYRELRIEPHLDATRAIEISCEIANVGSSAGEEVVQLYAQDPVASVTRPIQQLVGFARIPLAPNESRRLRFLLDQSQLAFYDAAMRFVIEPGEIRLLIGASSEDIRLRGSFTIEGSTRELSPRALVPTHVDVEPARPRSERG